MYKRQLLACCNFDIEKASYLLEELVLDEPEDLNLRLQQIKLLSAYSKHDEAEEKCKNLLSEPGAESSALFMHLWGSLLLKGRSPKSAARYNKLAKDMIDTDSLRFVDICNNYGWCLLLEEKLEEAAAIFQEGLAARFSLTTSLNLIHTLWRLEKHEEAFKIKKQLISIASFDRRVLSAAALT